MQNIVKSIKRPVTLNAQQVSISDLSYLNAGTPVAFVLPAQERVMVAPVYEDEKPSTPIAPSAMRLNGTYMIKVRQYMTKKGSPEFDFMAKWNNNIPMPFRVMRATVVKETRGMFMVTCTAVPMKSTVCMRCGRALTHPVSRLYGVGPECGGHAHINPFETEEELFSNLDKLTASLAQITWTGWIIKSAIEDYTEVTL